MKEIFIISFINMLVCLSVFLFVEHVKFKDKRKTKELIEANLQSIQNFLMDPEHSLSYEARRLAEFQKHLLYLIDR